MRRHVNDVEDEWAPILASYNPSSVVEGLGNTSTPPSGDIVRLLSSIPHTLVSNCWTGYANDVGSWVAHYETAVDNSKPSFQPHSGRCSHHPLTYCRHSWGKDERVTCQVDKDACYSSPNPWSLYEAGHADLSIRLWWTAVIPIIR